MHALRRIALAAAGFVAFPLLAQTSPKPPIGGCGVVTDPPVAPQVRLQTPPAGRSAVGRTARGNPSGSGPTVVVPGPPGPPWSSCAADIGAAISGDAIVPGAAGIAMNLLGDGFHPTSVTLGSVCVSDGSSPAAVPALQTAWSVDGSASPLQLAQQPQASPSGNRLDGGYATFWWQGYVYTLSVGGPVPLASGGGTGVPAGAGSDDATSILLRAVAELAPGLDIACFATRQNGTWSDLEGLGIGDPRPAIPAGYAPVDFQLTYLAAPTCAAAPSDAELSLSAFFQSSAGASIAIGAWSLGGGSPYPGMLQDGYVTWSSDRYQFSVSGSGADGSPLPSSTLVPIAKALDPTFSTDCVLRAVTLSPGDLAALGFRAPAAPAGYALVQSSMTGEVVDASCPRHFSFGGTYALFWSFAGGDGTVVSASAVRIVSDAPGPRTDPVVSDSCISWSDDRGTSFFVSGDSASGGPAPALDVLIAIARSMDPGLVIPN